VGRTKHQKSVARRWRWHNREALKKKRREYYLKNKARIAELAKQWRLKNQDRVELQHRQYYIDHRDGILARQKAYKRDHPKPKRIYPREYYKTRRLKTRHGLEYSDFLAMLDRQHHKCAVCFQDLKEDVSVDHNHKTNVVRGLLHRNCNAGLGMFGDSVKKLKGAILYLQRFGYGDTYV
jgi:hypothetical protein